MAHYDPSAATEIHTDASGHGIGAVLVQQQNKAQQVITYTSRLLSPTERKFSITNASAWRDVFRAVGHVVTMNGEDDLAGERAAVLGSHLVNA